VAGPLTATVNGTELPTTAARSIGWVVNVATVSLTRSEAMLLVAVPLLSLTTQRNWSSFIEGAVAIERFGVAEPP